MQQVRVSKQASKHVSNSETGRRPPVAASRIEEVEEQAKTVYVRCAIFERKKKLVALYLKFLKICFKLIYGISVWFIFD